MKQRENNRYIAERKDSKGRLLCLVPTCNKLRQKYKTSNRTRNYCKKHTFLDMGQFTNWQALRNKALFRDKKTCVQCKDNREEVVVIINRRITTNMMEVINGKEEKFKYEDKEYEETKGNFVVDHINPIALGGDEWDINNLQTLCLKCNKIKTAQDMKNIAKQRRINKKLKVNTTLGS